MAFSRYLYRGDGFRIGEMRCPPDDDLWSVECCEDNPLLGFPETGAWVTNQGLPPVVADSTRVMFHPPGRPYRRRLLDPSGYACSFIAMDVDFFHLLAEAVAARQAIGASTRPGAAVAMIGPLFFDKAGLLRHLRAADPPDLLFVEETALRVLDGCLAAGSPPASRQANLRSRPRTHQGHTALVEALKAELWLSFAENRSLRDLARSVHSSQYHLARIFRQQAGTTIHGYRMELRLRRGLELIADPGVDLASVATALGFASHSHFTTTFGRVFGVTPSLARRGAAGNRGFLEELQGHGELGTLMKAGATPCR